MEASAARGRAAAIPVPVALGAGVTLIGAALGFFRIGDQSHWDAKAGAGDPIPPSFRGDPPRGARRATSARRAEGGGAAGSAPNPHVGLAAGDDGLWAAAGARLAVRGAARPEGRGGDRLPKAAHRGGLQPPRASRLSTAARPRRT